MGLLDRAIKRGISQGVGQGLGQGISRGISGAIGKAVEQTVAPAANKWADKAAGNINRSAEELGEAASQTQQAYASSGVDASAVGGLGGMFASFQNAAMGFANEAAKNMKICPSCGEAAQGDVAFCPSCGAELPAQTLAEGSVCTSCGKQNTVGTKFCAGCGAKLPFAEAEESRARARDEAQLARWDELLPQFPKWCFGGHDISIEDCGYVNGHPAYSLTVCGTTFSALEQYRDLLLGSGFKTAGQYPTRGMLYKMDGGVCRCFESDDPFVSDEGTLSVSFSVGEPAGGFDYVKPAPRSKADGLDSILGMFKNR